MRRTSRPEQGLSRPPSPTDNLCGLVLATAGRHPDLLAIVSDNATLNYAQLGRLVGSFAGRMKTLGIGPGSCVALDSHDLNMVAPVILACSWLGAAWIAAGNAHLLPPGLRPSHRLAGADGDTATGAVVIDQSWIHAAPMPQGDADAVLPDDPFLYAPTSGTTGSPKLLALSQRRQVLRAFAAKADFVARETVFCSLFRADAYPYISRFLTAFVYGATVVQSRDIALWDAAGMNHLYGSVAQVAAFLGSLTLPRKFPMIHVSGAKLSDQLARHLLNNFTEVIDLYASTETNRSFKNVKFIDSAGAVGTRGQRLDSELAIVDDDGQPLPDGGAGHVRVRNAYLATGYLDNPEATARSFRDGWFHTGDIGQFGPSGALQVLGRTGDIVNLGGLKINVVPIDAALRAMPGVADAMCFDHPTPDGPNELLALVVPAQHSTIAEIAAHFERHVLATLGRDRSPRRFIAVNAVPRAHDGGAKRFACREIYAQQKGR